MRKINIVTSDGFHYCSVDADHKKYNRRTGKYSIVDAWSRSFTCIKVDNKTYQMTTNKGGARPGAGRKPAPNKKIKVSFSLRPVLIERLDQEPPRTKNAVIEKALCEHYGIDLGE